MFSYITFWIEPFQWVHYPWTDVFIYGFRILLIVVKNSSLIWGNICMFLKLVQFMCVNHQPFAIAYMSAARACQTSWFTKLSAKVAAWSTKEGTWTSKKSQVGQGEWSQIPETSHGCMPCVLNRSFRHCDNSQTHHPSLIGGLFRSKWSKLIIPNSSLFQ